MAACSSPTAERARLTSAIGDGVVVRQVFGQSSDASSSATAEGERCTSAIGEADVGFID